MDCLLLPVQHDLVINLRHRFEHKAIDLIVKVEHLLVEGLPGIVLFRVGHLEVKHRIADNYFFERLHVVGTRGQWCYAKGAKGHDACKRQRTGSVQHRSSFLGLNQTIRVLIGRYPHGYKTSYSGFRSCRKEALFGPTEGTEICRHNYTIEE